MNVYKYKDLKIINARVHHLLQGYVSFLPPEKVSHLKNDLLEIAQEEFRLNLIGYLTAE